MVTKKKSTRKSTKAQPKPRTKRGRRPRPKIKIVPAQPAEAAAADAPALVQLVKVNSAVVRRRQNAKAAGEAAPTKRQSSASEFVRGQPMEMSTKEVVAKAAKLGLKVTAGLVRVTRFKMRHAGDAKPTAAGKGVVRRGRPPKTAAVAGKAVRRGRPPVNAPAAAGGPTAAEAQFRRLVVDLGTSRAMALVAEVEKAVEAYLTS
jgi:hypothetical protein